MTHSANRINALAEHLSFASYLEIGVNQGETFRKVNIATRVGVDPKFRFDADSVRNERTELHEITSDDYFANIDVHKTFDLIFIDGLHTFEQVVRDLSNAVLHSHPRTVIILDDTRPSDVFSALPKPEDTAYFRTVFNSSSKDWHGDVYKAVFYVHDFWPSLNYVTISTGGNPQTVVWRSNSFQRKPLFNNLEHISRLDYFDFYRRMNILKLTGEEEAIKLCVTDLRDNAS